MIGTTPIPGAMPRNDAVLLMAEHGGALMTTPLDVG
jgi:hypothetical protein